MGLYQLKRDADGIVLVFNAAGYQMFKLEGRFSDVILMTYANMCSKSQTRGDDYLAGVMAGIMHMQMLRPDAFAPLPEIPPIPPADL